MRLDLLRTLKINLWKSTLKQYDRHTNALSKPLENVRERKIGHYSLNFKAESIDRKYKEKSFK